MVLNSGDASISLIDMSAETELRRVPALREPHHWALTPDGRDVIVGDSAGNQLLFLDPATGAVRRRMSVSDPYQLGFSPDGKWLVVNGLARNQIDIYDGATLALVKRIPLAAMPSHLAYSPDSRRVFVTLQATDRLAAIDLATLAPLWVTEIGKTPAGVVFSKGRLIVGIMGSDYVAVVDPADGHVERRIATGRGAHAPFVSPDGSTIYVGNRVEGTVSAIDATSLEVRRTYKLPGGADDMAFAPGGKMWVTQRFVQKVAVLDLTSGDFVSIPVGRSPHGIYLNAGAP
jgi:YVTN family beta-propeller protein